MNENVSTGRKIREARKRCGLTQQELAAASGLSASLITKLERDEYGGVRLVTEYRHALYTLANQAARTQTASTS